MSELKSERIVVSAPMSFSGSAQRIRNKVNILISIPLIFLVWCVVLIWYIFFGIFLIPYRLLRRGQRKNKKLERQHREVLEAARNSNKNG